MKLAEEFKLSSYATWETKTAAVIAKKTVENRARQLANEDADDVGERRAAMQRLYESEMNGWKVMLANQEETLDERKERIRERAYLLKNQRESERKNFVKEMYDKQWRDACDDARSLDSQAIMDKLLVDRKGAVDYAQGDGKVKEAEEAERQAGIWKEQMRELDRKEAADQKKRHDRNVAMRNTLDEQCAMLNGKKRELKTRNFNNEMKELAQWKQDEEDEKVSESKTGRAIAQHANMLCECERTALSTLAKSLPFVRTAAHSVCGTRLPYYLLLPPGQAAEAPRRGALSRAGDEGVQPQEHGQGQDYQGPDAPAGPAAAPVRFGEGDARDRRGAGEEGQREGASATVQEVPRGADDQGGGGHEGRGCVPGDGEQQDLAEARRAAEGTGRREEVSKEGDKRASYAFACEGWEAWRRGLFLFVFSPANTLIR